MCVQTQLADLRRSVDDLNRERKLQQVSRRRRPGSLGAARALQRCTSPGLAGGAALQLCCAVPCRIATAWGRQNSAAAAAAACQAPLQRASPPPLPPALQHAAGSELSKLEEEYMSLVHKVGPMPPLPPMPPFPPFIPLPSC